MKVIAGAGTGKTETLTRRFRWLVEENHFDPARILAVTFTEKAAAEMKSRIRAALTKADREPEAPLAVHTFHGFARTILTENCYRLGLPPNPKMLSDVRQRLFLDRLFQRLCNGEIDEPSLAPERLAELSSSGLADLQSALQGILYTAKGKGWSPDEFRERALAVEGRFYTALPAPDDALSYGGEKKGALCEAIRGRLASLFPCRDLEDCLDVRKLWFTNPLRSEPRTDIAAALDNERQVTQRFIDAGQAFYRLYEAERKALGALDFDDLVNEAVALLREPEIRARARQRYQYILVDEFQDTSPMQMELIRAVITPMPERSRCGNCPAEAPANLTIVGDKKQAIYAWRNARRENMDDILPCAAHTRVVNLTQNHRSRPGILKVANAIRLRIEPGDPDTWTAKTEPAVVHAPESFAGGKKADARRVEANYVAECIQHLIRENASRRYADIGVLIRKNSLFAELRRAFRDRGIPYVREGATGLLEEPTCKDVLAYLHAIADPLDDLHLVRVLKRPPVGLSDRDLVSMRYTEDALSQVGRGPRPSLRAFLPLILSAQDERLDADPKERLCALGARLETLAALQVALPVRDLLERLPLEAGLWDAWGADDRAAWANTLATLQAIADALEEDGAGLDVRDFLDAIEFYATDSRLAAASSESVMDGVHVLTVHQAKGLEFPVVFVIGMGEQPKAGSGWIWDDNWGVIPAVPDGAAKSVIAKWLRPRREEGADEEARCWYVAATRPKETLVVTSINDQRGRPARPPELPEHATLSDLLVSLDTCTVNVSRPEPARPRISAATPMPAAGPFTASFTAIEAMEHCPVSLWIDRHWRLPEAAGVGGGGSGRRIGILVHEAIERGEPDLERLFDPRDTDDVRDRVRALWTAFREHGAPPAVDKERAVQFAVSTPRGDVILNGFVDALVWNGPTLQIVDYKTNRELSDENLNAYALQMAVYRKALAADGLETSSAGKIIHIRPEGCEEHELDLVSEGLDARFAQACENIATVLAGPGMPAPKEGRECGYCAHRDVCPHAENGASAAEERGLREPDFDLFGPEWRPLVRALADAGFVVDGGEEIVAGDISLGTTVALISHAGRRIAVVNGDCPEGAEMGEALIAGGARVVAVSAGDIAGADEAIRSALEGDC